MNIVSIKAPNFYQKIIRIHLLQFSHHLVLYSFLQIFGNYFIKIITAILLILYKKKTNLFFIIHQFFKFQRLYFINLIHLFRLLFYLIHQILLSEAKYNYTNLKYLMDELIDCYFLNLIIDSKLIETIFYIITLPLLNKISVFI